MSEISLRDYLAKLDNLLNNNAADEVIHHCRHILQYFPKNVAAYRFLGRALIENGRWEEASAALQRVLSVIPDDFTAHVGLSEAMERTNRPDDALWHLERAFEQHPADKTILEQLRALYRRYRGVENVKIPLTAVAVARQAMNNQAYAHAADTLRGALNRSPQRVDLRLLLADVLWEGDARLEAAELAMDVLEKLPDCLSANRIMTGLWLSEGRPTDAQRYIYHLEAVDPYLAVELVTGSPVDEGAFRLSELDYRRSAQSAIAADKPDWLQDLDAPIDSAPLLLPDADESVPPADDQWDQWVSAMLQGTPKPADKPALNDDDDWMKAPDSPFDTGSLDPFQATNTGELSEIEALFQTGGLSKPVTSGLNADDPVAWLREAGIEIPDEEELPPRNALLYDDGEFHAPDETDPTAWMSGYAVDPAAQDDALVSDADADDLLAWLPFDDAQPSDDAPLSAAPADFPPLQQEAVSADDDFDWMNETGGTLTDAPANSTPDWLSESAVEPSNSVSIEETPPTPDAPDDAPKAVPGPKRGLTAMLNEATFDWNQAAQTDAVEEEWMAQFSDTPRPMAANVTPDWLTSLSEPSEQQESEQSDESPIDEFPLPDTGSLTWGDQVPQSGGAADDMPENNSGMNTNDDDFSWMSEFGEGESTPDTPVTNADVPDWLSELDPSKHNGAAGAEPPDSADSDENDLGWMSALGEPDADDEDEAEAEDEFAWLDEDASLEADEEADDAEPISAVPDWLAEAEPDSITLSAASPDTAADDDFDWMSGMELGSTTVADEPAIEAGAIPDWLTEIEAEADSTPDAAELQPVAAVDEPAAEADAVPDWLTELEPETWSAAQAVQAESGDIGVDFDALAEPAAELEAEPSASADDELSWMSDFADAIPDAAPVELVDMDADAIPDWLTELEPEGGKTDADVFDMPLSQADAFAAPTPSADAEIDWVSDLEPEDEPFALLDESADDLSEPVPAEEFAAMMESLEADANAEALPDAPETAAYADEIVAVDEVLPYSEEAAFVEALEPVEGAVEVAEEETPAAEADVMPIMAGAAVVSAGTLAADTWIDDEDEGESETEEFVTAAENAPDWLNAMVPGLDVNYAPDEGTAEEAPAVEEASPREFAWLSNMVEEELSETAPEAFAFSKPPAWLDRLIPPPTPAVPPPDVDLPDWVSDDDTQK